MALKITAVVWDTYAKLLKDVEGYSDLEVEVFTRRDFEFETDLSEKVIRSVESSDLILVYHSAQAYWMAIDDKIRGMKDRKKIISVGLDAMDFELTSVEPRIAIESYKYLVAGGQENVRRLMLYIRREVFSEDIEVLPPEENPWDAIVHPGTDERFRTLDDYLSWYSPKKDAPWVGIIMSRTSYITDGGLLEFEIVRAMESRGLNAILMYSMSKTRDDGSISIGEALKKYMMKDGRPAVDALVKISSFMIGDTEGIPAPELLRRFDVPIFQCIVTSTMSKEQFEASPGITNDISWCVALPELEGMIEPILLGFCRTTDDEDRNKTWYPDRIERLADRVAARIALGSKPNSEKKIVFLLNNSPCANADANIGAAVGLDSHQSMRNVLAAMRDAGYDVEVPENGKALIRNILDHKAMSDFRWTTKEDIAHCGGVVRYITAQEYREFFDTLPESVRNNVIETWGEPPGTGMVWDGKIMVTGVQYGNVIVGVQPKRGCFGSKCDGSVCRILHDPLCPPTHQYLATYHYFEEMWGADAVVHVGTHGNLEFLPGKSVGLTNACYPDIGIGRTPHFYIYNSDNPSEGTIAKRRSYATLIDHMQAVMTGSGLYEELEDLDHLLDDYATAKGDPSQAHQFKHLLEDAMKNANLVNLGLGEDAPLDTIVRRCHEELSKIRNSQMNMGMHVFGEIPQGDSRAEVINSILRYDTGDGCIRDVIAGCHGTSLKELYADQGGYIECLGMFSDRVIEMIGKETRDLICAVIEGRDIIEAAESLGLSLGSGRHKALSAYQDRILSISRDMDASDELGSFIHALGGGYTMPGPSGVITRGRADILPTGRNFYSLDPKRLPTKPSWRVGVLLAENTIKKYNEDTGESPESIAFFWMSGDLLQSGGEQMAQMMYLLGVIPEWSPDGQVFGFNIIPLEELGRPRIDITVRTSGILRDNFSCCIDIIDAAVRTVAELDEPEDMNLVRKHVLEARRKGLDETDSTARLFSAPPGSYSSGVNLAVYASSWKTEKDLAEIYIAANGYAYGNGRDGKALHNQFADSLSKVSVTYNKIASDEKDLLGCCCYFSNHGGLTAASRHLSGKDVKAYYGDTREPNDINVHTLADEIRRVVRTKLLNPRWIEGMKEHGYKGGADMMKRIVRVYGFEASTQEVDDWIFDDIANTFVNDDEMREFYRENNPYAMEEIARRLLEAQARGLWEADEETLEQLRENYVEIESWMEELVTEGEHQGGSVDIITAAEVESWNRHIAPIMDKVREYMDTKK